jgi:hypothetical protein
VGTGAEQVNCWVRFLMLVQNLIYLALIIPDLGRHGEEESERRLAFQIAGETRIPTCFGSIFRQSIVRGVAVS